MLSRSRLLARPLRSVSSQHVRAFGHIRSGGAAPQMDMYIPTPYIEENTVSKRRTRLPIA